MFSDFKGTGTCSTDFFFQKVIQYIISSKCFRWEVGLLLAGGRTYRHDGANSRFSQFCEKKAPKNQFHFQIQHSVSYYTGDADKSLARTRTKQATFPRVLWNLEIHYHIHNSPPHVPTLANSTHSSALHTFDRRSLFTSWSG